MKNNPYPAKFLWGASTSAFQVEGAANIDGKSKSIMDIITANNKDISTAVTADHYHHMKEDVHLMKELGMTSYRFSIAWTRIFPDIHSKIPNSKGVSFYHHLLDELLANGIEPIVTMYHFDLPYSLISEYGGWTSKKCIDFYVNYAKFLFIEYGNKVTYWLTINEQGVLTNDAVLLGISPDDKELLKKSQLSNFHMFLAQAKAFSLCHQLLPQAKIGPAVSYITLLTKNMSSTDALLAKDAEDLFSFSQMDVAVYGQLPKKYLNFLAENNIDLALTPEDMITLQKGKADFLALNWYCTRVVTATKDNSSNIFSKIQYISNPSIPVNDWGRTFDPVGIRLALQKCYDRYHLPIMITENGWSQRDDLIDGKVNDIKRVEFLKKHLYQIGLAINDGVNVFSYNTWSFLDVLSVHDGMDKRYGIIYVDQNSSGEKKLQRIKKESYYYYQKVISSNGGLLFH